MTLPGWVTVKPLLWAIAILLLVAGGLAIALNVAHADARAASAERDAALAERDARTGERDGFAQRVEELAKANLAWSNAAKTLQGELDRAQREGRRLDAENRRAIASARAEAADADRTLKRFVDQFASESRRPACAQALNQLEAACPALSTY